MNPERWHQIEEVFHRVLAASDEERLRLLDEACAGDADLRREVSALIAGAPNASASIRQVLAAEVDRLASDVRALAVGRRLGPYRLRALLGEGGMGAVYLADRDDAQFAKQVAIKILPHAIGSPQAVARFRDERQILAALEHRNIVRLLDGGSTDEGLPYLVMEHIEGLPITAFARKHGLSIRARVQLVRDVCAAIQYAHQKLIIHRDIKPANILVDEAGTPKLVDFGIAKLLAPVSSFERQARTRTGFALFTPEYASPEQARGEPVSTATDVYSVGAVLYELLTDQPPHRTTGDVLESIRIICEVDPVRPSLVALPDCRRELAGDLDNIILKALHKDPDRRYASTEQLSDDLGRFLDDLPVNARVATLGYRVRKFAGRNKVAVLTVTLVLTALVASTAISLRQAARADAQAWRAEEAAANALAEKSRAEVEKTRAESETARAQAEAERARRAERQVQEQLGRIEAEEARRREAEDRESIKDRQVEMTREQLEVALAKARREQEIAKQESMRAREAERRAEEEADRARLEAARARDAERQVQTQLAQLRAEKARRKEAETRESIKDRQVEMTRRALASVVARKQGEQRDADQRSARANKENQAAAREDSLLMRIMLIFHGLYQP